jgi:pyruvate carboxylase
MIGSQASAVAIVCLLGTTALAEETQPDPSGTYLCKLTASAGLRLDIPSQTWSGTVFTVQNEALLVKVVDHGQNWHLSNRRADDVQEVHR